MIDLAKAKSLIAALPLAHKVLIVAAVGLLVIAAAAFFRWVSQPSYAVLYGDLDQASAGEVMDELEAQGIDYRLEGSRIEVPREDVHTARASLAQEGLSGAPQVPGYELMDEQGLSVSEFRQEVDYKRALEGELTRTIEAMRPVETASVHLSVPDRAVFEDDQDPVTASVMIGTRQEMPPDQVESIAGVVASAVEGLETDEVTVADTEGRTLHSPDVAGSAAGLTSRQMRQTREFEEALSDDVGEMLATITGDDRASVTVRAGLDYDEREVESETHDPDSQVALRDQRANERYEGTNITPGGAVGMDGGPVEDLEGEIDYESDSETTEYGVDRVVERVVDAPGGVEELSVAVVMDDGSATGADVPPLEEVENLVTAALGLDAERGDDLAISALPFPQTEETVPEVDEPGFLAEQLPAIVGAIVLLLIAVALFLLARRRSTAQASEPLQWEPLGERDLSQTQQLPGAPQAVDQGAQPTRELQPSGAARLTQEVGGMVDEQPEEIAQLLRSWLADDT